MGSHEEAERLLSDARRLDPEFRMGDLDLVLGKMRLDPGDVAGAREPLPLNPIEPGGHRDGNLLLSLRQTHAQEAPMAQSIRATQHGSRRATSRLSRWSIQVLTLTGSALLLFGCGSSTGNGTPGDGTISGRASKGPVNGAAVGAFAIGADGMMGAQIGSTTSDAQGGFTLSVGGHSGAVMLKMTGGTYTDEATGTAMTMGSGDVMTAVVPTMMAGASVSEVQITPLTTMAQGKAQNMSGGMTPANAAAANGDVGGYFSVNDILMTAPMDPTMMGAGAGATQDAKNYGMSIAAMSRYAATIGMTTSSSGIVTVMMKDASDGTMNGMMGATAISMMGMGGMMDGTMQTTAGTTGLATAMTQFVGSTMNRSGVSLTDMQPLVDHLSASTGEF